MKSILIFQKITELKKEIERLINCAKNSSVVQLKNSIPENIYIVSEFNDNNETEYLIISDDFSLLKDFLTLNNKHCTIVSDGKEIEKLAFEYKNRECYDLKWQKIPNEDYLHFLIPKIGLSYEKPPY